MLDETGIGDVFETLGLDTWSELLLPICNERVADGSHGDMPAWRQVLDCLPEVARAQQHFDRDAVTVGAELPDTQRDALEARLLELSPWRKGPFEVCGIDIDAEWRSNLKWDRIREAIGSLHGQAILDVGCGNGYYALRMIGAGARLVLGLDPTLLYVVQFAAIRHFTSEVPAQVLPLRLNELPAGARAFDTTFSMGVLYHQRSPIDHLRELRQTLKPGGRLLLETLFVPGEESYACTPPWRYARMRNVWLLPTLTELQTWLARTGYRNIEVIDQSTTSVDEQRTTRWMPFESLAEALDPERPGQRLERHPASRALFVD